MSWNIKEIIQKLNLSLV